MAEQVFITKNIILLLDIRMAIEVTKAIIVELVSSISTISVTWTELLVIDS